MKYLFLDVETTTKNKGNPYTKGNMLCYIGFQTNNLNFHFWFPEDRYQIEKEFYAADYLVGFNLKFDLSWLRRYGLDIFSRPIWDCQLAEFILNRMTTPYPSLEEVAVKYKLGHKQDIVKQMWEEGIDTPDIPLDIMREYLEQDVFLTKQIFLKQYKQFKLKPHLFTLFKLQCEDLLVLQDMEWSGLPFNVGKANEAEDRITEQINRVTKELYKGYEGVPINWNSGDHLSAYLYGGNITVVDRIPVGTYKSGIKEGQTRYSLVDRIFPLPKLVDPLPNSELKKGGVYSVDEPTLRSLKGNAKFKKARDLLLEYSKLEKIRSTYLRGLKKRIIDLDFADNTIHGKFNQVVAVTGRLSSSEPNLQNLDDIAKELMETRYAQK